MFFRRLVRSFRGLLPCDVPFHTTKITCRHIRRSRRDAAAEVEVLSQRLMLSGNQILVDTLADAHEAGHTTFREAVAIADNDPGADTISFQDGLTGTILLTQGEIHITNSMTITGPGADILSISGNSRSRILNIDDGDDAVDQHVSIASLTLRDAFVNDSTANQGGAINNLEDLSISDSLFTGNWAGSGSGTGFGGAIKNEGTLSITGVTFDGNRTDFGGGAISNGGTVTSDSCTFINNTATFYGGALYNFESFTSLHDAFTTNSVGGNGGLGGGVYNTGTFTSDGAVFSFNSSSSGRGGGIFNSLFGTLNTSRGQFHDNIAAVGGAIGNLGTESSTTDFFKANRAARGSGGGAVYNQGTLTTQSDVFTENIADGSGGGILNEATVISTNDTFLNNVNSDIRNEGGVFTAINDTIVGNSASYAVYSNSNWNSINTIITGNVPNDFFTDHPDRVMTRNTWVRVVNPVGAIPDGVNGNRTGVTADSIFTELALRDNGGPIQTIALKPDSLAIAAGAGLATLSAAIDASATELSVIDPTFIAVGQSLRLGSEILLVTGISGSAVTVLRAQGGTLASEHPVNSVFTLAYDQRGVVRVTNDLGSYAAPGGPGFMILESGDSTVVAEHGAPAQEQDSFTVALNVQPTSNVVLTISSANTNELTLSPSRLILTPSNFNIPQAVTIAGVFDNVADGNQSVNITISVDTSASDGAYSSVPSQIVHATVLDVPNRPVVTGPVGGNQVALPTFTWNDVSGETAYSLYLINRASNTVVYSNNAIPADTTSFQLPAGFDLPSGDYRFWINSIGTNGYSASGSPTDFSVGPASVTPISPTVTGTSNSGQGLARPRIDWNNVTGATTYGIYLISLNTQQVVSNQSGLPTNSFIPTGDLPNGRYRIFVNASNVAGTSPFSAPFDFDVGAPATPPQAPTVTGTTDSGLGLGRPQINWNSVSGATYYGIYLINLNTQTLVTNQSGLTANSFVPAGNLPIGRYRIFVNAGNARGISSFSSPFDFTVGAITPPVAPTVTGTSDSGLGLGRPQINWNSSPGATSYGIYLINLNTQQVVSNQSGLMTNNFTPAANLPNGRYRIFVNASNAAGLSAFSAPFDFDVGTPLTPPKAPTVTGTSDSGFGVARPQINWTSEPSATSFGVYLINMDTQTVVYSRNGLTSKMYTPAADLPPGRYRVWISATNAAGTSPQSSPFDFMI